MDITVGDAGSCYNDCIDGYETLQEDNKASLVHLRKGKNKDHIFHRYEHRYRTYENILEDIYCGVQFLTLPLFK